MNRTTVADKPKLVTLDVTNRCNLRCVQCPHGVNDNFRKERANCQDIERGMIDSVSDFLLGAKKIHICGMGEPMLAAQFPYVIKVLIDGGYDQILDITSNATLLTKARRDLLLSSPASYLVVSCDAATEETYRKIRGHDFNVVVDNIRSLIRERNALGRWKPMVGMNMTLMRENIEELIQFVDLAKDLGVDEIHFFHLNGQEQMQAPENEWIVERNGWTFNYAEQCLIHYPELSNRIIRQALDHAEEIGMKFGGDIQKELFFDVSK